MQEYIKQHTLPGQPEFGELTIQCDGCSDEEKFEGSEQECIDQADEELWITDDEDEDLDFCGIDCQQTYYGIP